MNVNVMEQQAIAELVQRHRELYDGPEIDSKLEHIIRGAPQSNLSSWDIHRLLRTSRSLFFDTHVEVVSGHHTATYLRFESVARIPQLVKLLTRDMADWIRQTFQNDPIAGLVAATSAAECLAEGIADVLHDKMRLRVTLTPYNGETGRIGTEIRTGAIHPGERFVALNDVTTRGQCVSKLGKVITDHGGALAGMMVFARRDSGQFPLMNELTANYPFFYAADLDMPQWEPDQCPLCRLKKPLLSWKDIPEC